jgi:hypothetical protein
MGSDPQYIKFPNLSLAQDVFNLSNPACAPAIQQTSLKKLQDVITEQKMAPLYRHLAHPTEGILNNSGEGVTQHPQNAGTSTKPLLTSNMLASRKTPQKFDFPWDEKLYQSLLEDNKKELESFQKEEDDAEEAAGETEVQAARGKRAEFWARVGDKVRLFIIALLILKFTDDGFLIGQSYRIARGPPRKDRFPWYQDRLGACYAPHRTLLRGSSVCEQDYRTGRDPGRERWRLGPQKPSQGIQGIALAHHPLLQPCRASPSRQSVYLHKLRTVQLLFVGDLFRACRIIVPQAGGLQGEGGGRTRD